MSLKHTLQLKMSQQLAMTPQLQQAIRLLQLSTLELQTELHQHIESNPLLELEEESDPIASDRVEHPWENADRLIGQTGPLKTRHHGETDDLDPLSQRAESTTLTQHLLAQLLLIPLSETDRMMAMAIVDALDDDGYLRVEIPDLVATLDPQWNLQSDDLLPMLHLIQHLDPPGIAAQSVQECLYLQLQALPRTGDPTVQCAKTIVAEHLDLCAQHNYPKLAKILGVPDPQLRAAIKLIQSLNPRPGSHIATLHPGYVIPDVFVFKNGDQWQVELNPRSLPKVRIQDEYASWIKRSDNSPDQTFLKTRLQEARWLLKSLESRNETLLRVSACIVEHQSAFFDHGEEALKPMVLQDVANALHVHESTISRITTQKYLHAPRGIYELKYFFSSHVTTEDGGECSSRAIRSFIKKLIAEESPDKPLSDHHIALILEKEGIQIARRTIAKYRDQLQIPSSSVRKKLKWLEKNA